MGTADVLIPMTLMLIKEVTIKGSFRYGVSCLLSLMMSALYLRAQPGDYPFAISLVAQGKVDLKPLVTHRFALRDQIEFYSTDRDETASPSTKLSRLSKPPNPGSRRTEKL